jgi:hypothetical protein
MPQIIHGPTVFNDDECYPFRTVLYDEDDDAEDQGDRLDDPEYHIKDFFVAGSSSIIGDVLQKIPDIFLPC